MCRLLAYQGSPITLSEAILAHPHSLVEQAYAPAEMVTGTVNADGFGIGWYAETGGLPGTYHRLTPIWSDLDLPRLGRVVSSGRIVAALRNATPGFPLDLQSISPFVSGRYLFVHDGALQGFARRFRSRLLEGIPEAIQATILGPTDAEMIFALVRSRLEERGEVGPEESPRFLRAAIDSAIRQVIALALEKQVQVSVNIGLTDGQSMVFCRLARGIPANSLYVRSTAEGVWVVSERLDDSDTWERVSKDGWVVVDAAGSVSVSPIEDLPPEASWA